jgi:hypothetical protein
MTDTNEKEERPDEDAGILVEEFLKIHDPESGAVHYEGRT